VDLLNSVEVDSDVLEDYLESIEDTFETVGDTIEDFVEDGFGDNVTETFASAYKTAVGEYIISFAKTVVPVYEAQLDIASFFILNEGCNTT
jgi:hypothetical protein